MDNMYLKRKKEAKSELQSAPEEAKNRIPALPNSLLLAMHGKQSENRHNPELENIMKSRLAAFRHQIPSAESEADKLSAGITSGTPEQVKQSMGERLGADFSSVRFHTGESVSQKADNIGARAWTQGNDVYFGEGGFHPAVAAHELVHTAQQGAVGSTTINALVPMGEVQMWPNPFRWIRNWYRRRMARRQQAQPALTPQQQLQQQMQPLQHQLQQEQAREQALQTQLQQGARVLNIIPRHLLSRESVQPYIQRDQRELQRVQHRIQQLQRQMQPLQQQMQRLQVLRLQESERGPDGSP